LNLSSLTWLTSVTAHAWVIQTVDPLGDELGLTISSMAVDGADKAHISYGGFTNDDLKYAAEASGPPGLCTATADASAYEASPVYGPAGLSRHLTCFLLPIGAVMALKFWRRRTIL